MRKTLMLIAGIILLVSCSSGNQNSSTVKASIDDCDWLSNYHWIKKTFEENDAGYQWVIEEKGLAAYQHFCDSIEEEIRNAKDIYECNKILNDWGKFFRKGHFNVQLNLSATTNEKISEPKTVNYTVQTISDQIKITGDKMIGVWSSPPYKIGIVQDTVKSGRKYIGFIIDSKVPEWEKGQVKLEVFEENNQHFAHFYMRDYSIDKRSVLLESEVDLYVGNMHFIKNLKSDTLEQNLLSTTKPLFYNLSEQTTLLRIPSFNSNHKSLIDRLIEKNRDTILLRENLIIDLRKNGGGSDRSWKEIIPLIYTNPIKTVGVEFLSTSLNRKYLKDNMSFVQKLFSRKLLKKLDNNDGEFVRRDSIYITEFDEVLLNPQNVIILVDEHCASSVEQFLLAAKQSKKVKIYGKKTFGALDVSNVTSVISPDRCFLLGYCISRTLRSKSNRIDNVGIMPDFEINDSIPKYEWINFILNRFE